MGKIKRYGNAVERMLSGERGQRFFNFAYSVGAAIVICGAMFKFLDVKGGNTLLCIGMGTEVIIFLLSAFDRPARDYNWESVFPQLDGLPPSGAQPSSAEQPSGAQPSVAEPSPAPSFPRSNAQPSPAEQPSGARSGAQPSSAAPQAPVFQAAPLPSLPSSEIEASIAALSEQMQTMSRNLSTINALLEQQLKSAAGQLDALENMNRGMRRVGDTYESVADRATRHGSESEKLTANLEKLNRVYARMLDAMNNNPQP